MEEPVGSPDDGPRPSAAPAGRRRTVASAVAAAACAAGAGWLQSPLAPDWDHAVLNVASLCLLGVAALIGVGWMLFFAPLSRAVRVGTVVLVILAIVAFRAAVRVEQVTGELIPSFSWRWAPRPDERLGDLDVGPGEAPVDVQTTTPEDFPQFLGPRRDAAAPEVALARDWTRRPPRLLWRRPIGAGWSAFAVVNGFAVTMEQRGPNELVVCYEAATGRPRWRHAIAARHETTLGGVGPRATPTIHQGRVYALGATGVLRCLDGATGRPVWSVDLLADMGSDPERDLRAVAWGRANSPLVVDGLVVTPYGGPPEGPFHSLAAFDAETGRRVWLGGERQAAYSSPRLATLAGVRQILIVNEDYASGHDPATGRVLWEHPWPGKSNANANVSQPVPLPPNRVLLSKAYGGGAALVELAPASGGGLTTRVVWRNRSVLKTKFTNVAVWRGCAFGLSDGVLECVDLETGRRLWRRGRYGHGQILRVGELLLVQAESGEVAMVEASPEGYHELGRFRALDGKTWNNPCLFGRVLLVRNAQEAAAYELP